MIVVKHCCSDCKNNLPIPTEKGWELICLKSSPSINETGGVTECTQFEEKK